MRVFLVSAYSEPRPRFVPDWLERHGGTGGHEICTSSEEAELVIFAETFASLDPFFIDVLRHPVFLKDPNKCVLHHNSDSSVTLCRTVSPSVEAWQPNQGYRRSFHYIARRRDIDVVEMIDRNVEPKWLFSFRGDENTHPVRKRILALKTDCAVLEAVSGIRGDGLRPEQRREFHLDYCRSILEAKFVLCPRGLGPTSMRVFEVMQLGRVPVIIGDSWKRIEGVQWNECALFVSEKNVEQIPKLLEEKSAEAGEMGRRARAVWEERFSPERSLERLIEECAATLTEPMGALERAKDMAQLIPTRHWRALMASLWRRCRFGKANRH